MKGTERKRERGREREREKEEGENVHARKQGLMLVSLIASALYKALTLELFALDL